MLYGLAAMAMLWVDRQDRRRDGHWRLDLPIVWPGVADGRRRWRGRRSSCGCRTDSAAFASCLAVIVLIDARYAGHSRASNYKLSESRARRVPRAAASARLLSRVPRRSRARAAGVVPDWSSLSRALRARPRGRSRRSDRLPPRNSGSSGGATAARCRCWSRIVLPFELALLVHHRVRLDVVRLRAADRPSLLTPIVMAGFAARDREQGESVRARCLRRDAVHRDAADDERAADRREAEDGDAGARWRRGSWCSSPFRSALPGRAPTRC